MSDSVMIAGDVLSGGQDTKLYQLLDSLTSGIFLVNSDLQVTYLNAYGETCFSQLCEEEFVLDTLLEQPSLFELRKNVIEVFDTRAVDRSEITFTNPKGEQIWLGFTLTCPVSTDDIPAVVFGVFKDITQLKSLEQKRGWNYGVQSISLLASIMVQELRPLFENLARYSDLYHRERNIQEKLLQVIEETADRGLQIVSKLDNFTPDSVNDCKDWSLSSAAMDVIGLLEAELSRRGVEFSTSLQSSGKVLVPHEVIKKILLDLMTNFLLISEEPGSMDMKTYRDDLDFEVLELQNDRLNLSDKELKNLFIPLMSSENSEGLIAEGLSGLDGPGLFLACAMIHEYGGDLRADSSENGGTLFQLKVPVARD